MRLRLRRAARGTHTLLATALTLAACSSSDGRVATDTFPWDSSVTAPTTATNVASNDGTLPTPPASGDGAVTQLSLAQLSVEPFDRVAIDGVEVVVIPDENGSPTLTTEPDMAGVELVMYLPGSSAAIPMDLLLDESGVSTIVAMNPLDPLAGGPAQVQFVDGDTRGTAIDVEIAGLERAPGARNHAVETVIAAIEEQATALGSSPEALATADMGSLKPDLRALKVALGMFDDGTGADIESVPDDFDEQSLELLDALVGRVDVLAALPGFAGTGPQGFAPARSSEQTEPASVHGFRAAPSGMRAAGLDCTEFDLDIPDGDALAAAMQKGVSSQMGATTSQLTEDVSAANRAVSEVNDAASVSGSPAVAGTVGAATVAIGALDTLYAGLNVWAAIDAGRYPSRFNSIDAAPSLTEFNEDFTEDGIVENVSVVVSSTGFDGSSWGSVAASATNTALSAYSASTGNTTASGLGLSGQVGDAIGLGLDKIRESATGQAFAEGAAIFTSWCPRTWTVPLTNAAHVSLKAALGNLDADDPGFAYRPEKVGNDFLTVSTRGFHGTSISTQFSITIHRLQVVATPSRIEVKQPGEVVDVTAYAEYANTPSLEWDPGQGAWNDGGGPETDGEATRRLYTPADPGAYPFDVTVRSTSETGLREESRNDPRDDTVEVVLAPFIVFPDPGSVQVNQQIGFAATDHDGNPVEVTWTATGGQISRGPSSDAVYTAGDEPGTYEVVARRGNDSVTVAVQVIEASCLVGTWQLNHDRFAELLNQSGTNFTPAGGAWLLTVSEDLAFTSSLEGFAFEVETGGFASTVIINGTQTGSIAATATQITEVVTTSSSVDVVLQTPAGPISAPAGDSPVGTEFVGGAYQCDDGVLFVENTGHQLLWDRVS